MKQVLKILFCFFSICIFLVSCQKEEQESLSALNFQAEVELVENENNPEQGSSFLTFEEDLSIYKENWWPRQILVDEEGYIYVLADKRKTLIKFNSKGTEIRNKEFPKGQAPGEFEQFDPCFSYDGRLFVVDGSQRRLTVIDRNFEILNISNMKFWGGLFRLDSDGNMYFLVLKFLDKTRDRQRLILTKYSPSGTLLHEIIEYQWGAYRDKVSGVYHHDIYPAQLKYKIDSQNNIYYALSDSYEINVVSPEGKVIRKITKTGSSRKITQKEILKYKPKSRSNRLIWDVPEHMPYIAELFILDNNYLLVITFENDDDEPTLFGDIFNEKGVYIAKVQVPKYYSWYYLREPFSTKNNAVYKNNHFYTIEADEGEENFYVKRYKMIWE